MVYDIAAVVEPQRLEQGTMAELNWQCTICRGGPLASSHVESLANVELMEDVLKVVAGMGHTLKDAITSDIAVIADKVTCFDDNSC